MSAAPVPSDTTTSESRPRWSIIGPGLVVAATGVGAADLVATLIAGSNYGYALFWAVVVGCVMKVVLVEGAGRYSLATGRTIYEGWASLGTWTTVYFAPYIVIWGFVYSAAAMAGTGLPLNSLLPFFSAEVWGILSGLIGLALVWFGRYGHRGAVLADPRVRRTGRPVHAVPRGPTAAHPQQRPGAAGVAQQAALERADGGHGLVFLVLTVDQLRKLILEI